MEETAVLVAGAHRSIRTLEARESVYGGALVTDGQRRAVRVPASAVADELWLFAGAEHIVGVLDLVRRRDGHDALLPWCVERVEALVGRRTAAGARLSAGEVVTLVGSLLRGVVEAGGREITGQWWLSHDARPVFAPGEGSTCAVSAAALIAQVRETGVDRVLDRLLGEIAAATADRRVVERSIDRWERALTEHAAPRPLDREVREPPRAAGVEGHRTSAVPPVDVPSLAVSVVPRFASAAVRRARSIVAAVASHMPRLSRRRAREAFANSPAPSRARGRALLVGAAAAGVVLLGGVLWPAAEQDSAAIETGEGDRGSAVRVPVTPRESGAASQAPDPAHSATPARNHTGARSHAGARSEIGATPSKPASRPRTAPGTSAERSIERRGAALLAAVALCARDGDTKCAGAVADGAGALVHERLGEGGDGRAITLVEEYGDVAVLRLAGSEDRGDQMLVLVSEKDRWLVRDVYDVANQPRKG